MSHTPGPWTVFSEVNVVAGRRGIATTGHYSSSLNADVIEAENKANAILISTAPDLLAAMEAILQTFAWAFDDMLREYPDTPQPKAILAARAAIARAKGVS